MRDLIKRNNTQIETEMKHGNLDQQTETRANALLRADGPCVAALVRDGFAGSFRAG